jgi:predicted DNA-binding transcriptional regulator AlpA
MAPKRRKKKTKKRISPVPSAPALPGGPAPGKDLFRPDEVAGLAGLSKRTVYRMLERGALLRERQAPNAPWRVSRAVVVELLERGPKPQAAGAGASEKG